MKAVIALVLGLAVFPAFGQLLKCTSKDGKVEYATQCPPGTQEVKTGIKSGSSGPAPSGAAPTSKSLAEREANFRKRQAEKAEAESKQQKDAAEAAQRKRACEEARNYLAGLEAGARVTRVDPKTGERVFLEDAARAAEIARARESVQANCK
ncbi:MAG: hypothetical protein HYY78_21470 [Betaproteobacteria bacterium]|nr:hypothetical protein [Betaproteobacteria bacterium]